MRPILPCLFFVFMLFSCDVVCADTEPLAYWPFDDGSGTVAADAAGNADGVLLHGPVWSEGILGGSLLFDGQDDSVYILEYPGILGTSGRTCCAWIRTTLMDQRRGSGPIVTWGNNEPGQKWMFRINSEGELSVGVWDGYIRSTQRVNDGQWHHVAAVLYDNGAPNISEVRLYIDGLRVKQTYVSNPRAINTVWGQNVTIGQHSPYGDPDSDQYFQGFIDDVRIYDTALSSQEIQTLVELVDLSEEPVLMARWEFDEGDGTVAEDSVGDADAILRNGATWGDGVVNSGLFLDGFDEYAEVVGYEGITGSLSRTCCAWIKTTASQAGTILSWGVNEPGQKWMFTINDGALGVGVWEGFSRTAQVVNDGRWHHVAAVLGDDGVPEVSDIRFYIDGVLQTDSDASNSRLVDTAAGQNVLIGASFFDDVLSNVFHGLIDDVRIYGSALTTGQIKALAGDPPLLAHWNFDEGRGSVVNDSAGEADGVLTNTPVWASGVTGSGLSFDGVNDAVTIPGFSGITGAHTRTCCAWIKTSSETQVGTILSWGINEPGQKWMFRVDDDGALGLGVWGGFSYTLQTVNDGFWHHVAVVLANDGHPDSRRPLFYIDGILQDKIDSHYVVDVQTSGTQDVVIGANYDDNKYGLFFSGQIDDVRIYPVALDAEGIRQAAGLDFTATLWVDDDYQPEGYEDRFRPIDPDAWGEDPIWLNAANDGHVWGVNAFKTIREAIDHARYGTTIYVAAGRYVENVSLKNGVKLIGAGPAVTVIEGASVFGPFQGNNAVVSAFDCDAHTVIEGFTLMNGQGLGLIRLQYIGGGGVYCEYSDLIVRNCRIFNNRAYAGGGMYAYHSNPVIVNCVFSENTALEYGGGGLYADNSYMKLINCTFSGNHANGVGGGAIFNENSDTEIVNSILWNNSSSSGADEISNEGTGFVNIRYSDVAGCGGSGTGWNPSIGIDGGGNIDTDPLFGGFYQLQSPAGRFIQSVEASWVFDDAVSPCIDAGDPSVVIGREPLPNGGVINMGAYGGTTQASKSYFETACDVLIAGDINGDCRVNLLDCSLMALHWLEEYEAAP